MLLVVEIGNTCMTMCLYKGKKLERESKMSYSKGLNAYALSEILLAAIGKEHIDDCIISSVVNELTGEMHQAISNTYKVNSLILNSDLDLGIKLKVKNPETIGSDRLANIVGAINLYDRKPLVVIDSGTATTFDVIDKNGDFTGGVIMPGFEMQLKALHDNTSKLPLIEINNTDKAQKIIGGNTKSQMISGVIRGHICGIEGLLAICEKELEEKPFVVLTGGGVDIIKKYLPKDKYNVINPQLTTEGARIIYERNMD